MGSVQGCVFCTSETVGVSGICLDAHMSCPASSSQYASGCPSPYTGLILVALLLYLAAFSTGVSPVPWAVNAEIYPQEVTGVLNRPYASLAADRKHSEWLFAEPISLGHPTISGSPASAPQGT